MVSAIMPYKKRAITYYKREGNPRIEYWVVDDSDRITTCSPTKWHRVALPDQTTLETLAKCADIRYRATQKQFNKQVDDNAWLRNNPPPAGVNRMVHLCQHVGITV